MLEMRFTGAQAPEIRPVLLKAVKENNLHVDISESTEDYGSFRILVPETNMSAFADFLDHAEVIEDSENSTDEGWSVWRIAKVTGSRASMEGLEKMKRDGRQTWYSLQAIIDMIEFQDWRFALKMDTDAQRPYLQLVFESPCAFTGEPQEQRCRKWPLSWHMCDSEVVNTGLGAVLSALEHEAREHFSFNGRRIFNPHRSAKLLWETAVGHGCLDMRTENSQQEKKRA